MNYIQATLLGLATIVALVMATYLPTDWQRMGCAAGACLLAFTAGAILAEEMSEEQ